MSVFCDRCKQWVRNDEWPYHRHEMPERLAALRAEEKRRERE